MSESPVLRRGRLDEHSAAASIVQFSRLLGTKCFYDCWYGGAGGFSVYAQEHVNCLNRPMNALLLDVGLRLVGDVDVYLGETDDVYRFGAGEFPEAMDALWRELITDLLIMDGSKTWVLSLSHSGGVAIRRFAVDRELPAEGCRPHLPPRQRQ